MKINPRYHAQKLLDEIGFDEITDIPIDLIAITLNAIVIEESLTNCDGKIIFGKNKHIIKVNSNIQFIQRKRFIIAHEIGHLIMHRNLQLQDDTFSNFNVFSGMENALRNGTQEVEANEFASELLMPHKIFLEAAKHKTFTPKILKLLSERFNSSITATAFKYIQTDLHPICIVFVENGKVKYWKKSDALNVWFGDYIRLQPPKDSVASEYIEKNYEYVYKIEEKAQIITKSTWFRLNANEEDSNFFEYCIPSKKHKTLISIIWED
jgi:Zn-dependent peptidase ImmA (M78 family)